MNTQDVSAVQPPVENPMECLWIKLRMWEMPSQADYLNCMGALNILAAMLMLACGLVYLLQGWKVFKVLVIVNAAILGALIGSQLGTLLKGANMPLFGAIAGGVLLAVVAWPLMKYSVTLMGALAGCFMGYGAWHYVANAVGTAGAHQYAWAGALMGLIVMGLLSFVIFKVTIIIFTCFQGALLTVSGALAILMAIPATKTPIENALNSNFHLMPLMIVVPAVIGFAFQYTGGGKKGGAKKPAPAGAPA